MRLGWHSLLEAESVPSLHCLKLPLAVWLLTTAAWHRLCKPGETHICLSFAKTESSPISAWCCWPRTKKYYEDTV